MNTKYPNKILLTTSYNSLVLEMGFSMNCPELPRCTVTDCEINIKHRHGSEPYRGESMFIGRNKRSERLFKK